MTMYHLASAFNKFQFIKMQVHFSDIGIALL